MCRDLASGRTLDFSNQPRRLPTTRWFVLNSRQGTCKREGPEFSCEFGWVPWCACTNLAALQTQKEQLGAGNVSAGGQIQASSLLDHLVVLTPFSGGFPKHLCEDAS